MSRALIHKGIRWNVLFTLITAVSSILLYILLSRYWTSKDIADLAIFQAIIGTFLFLINNSFNYYFIQHDRIDQKVYSEILSWSFLLGICSCLLLTITSSLYLNWYDLKYLVLSFGIGSLLIPVWSVTVIKKAVWQKSILHGRIAKIQIFCSFSYYVIAITAILIGYKVQTIALLFLIRYFAEAVFYLLFVSSSFNFSIHIPKSRLPLVFVKELFVERALTFSITQFDILFLGLLISKEWLGVYELFKRLLFRPLSLLNGIFDNLFFAYITLAQNINKKWQTYFRVCRMVYGLVIPVYVGLFIFSSWIIDLLLGDAWSGFQLEFQLFCIAGIFHLVNNPIDSVLIASQKIKPWNWLLLYLFIIQLVLLYVGSTMNLTAIVGALMISFMLGQITIQIRYAQMDQKGWVIGIIKMYFLPSSIAIFAASIATRFLSDDSILLQMICYIIVTVIGFILFHHDVINDYKSILSFGEK